MYLLSTLIEDQLCLLMFPINDNNGYERAQRHTKRYIVRLVSRISIAMIAFICNNQL